MNIVQILNYYYVVQSIMIRNNMKCNRATEQYNKHIIIIEKKKKTLRKA